MMVLISGKNMRYIAQFDESDCGAACLAMIATEYGSKWSLARVREVAGTDKEGTNLYGVTKAAEKMGFEAKALKSEEKILDQSIPLPMIAHVEKGGILAHYVVVHKISKDYVWVYDPDPGARKQKMTMEAFKEEWTGYAIFLNPTPEFMPAKESKGRLAKFIPLIKPHTRTIVHAIVASLVLTVLGLLGSFYFAYLVDEILPSKAEFALHILSVGIILLTLFQVGLGVIRDHMLLHFGLKSSLALNFSYLKHVLQLPLSFFDTRKVGEILSRLGDGAKVRGLLSHVALSVIMDIFMMIVAAGFLIYQEPILFVVAVAAVPLSTIVLWSFARFFRENYREQMSHGAEVQSFLVETLNGMPTVKGLNASKKAFYEVEKRMIKSNKTAYKGSKMGNIQGFLVGLIDGWGGNVLFWVGSYLILKDQMTLGSLMAFNALLGYFLGPLKRMLGLQTSIQEALVAADRLGEVMELDKEIQENHKSIRPAKIHGKYCFQNVKFRYGSRRPVFEDMNLEIPAGSKVAFVGPSGCGKSTLIKLMMKFYVPEEGEITIDEKNIKDIDTEHLRQRIGYVPQEVFLFSGSIYENITMHKPEATYEDVIEAAKRAQAHDFINELPNRYETVLAERGASLSGGERQRLALARALLGKPDVLVFDEATSNLDVITEKSVHETIRELANDGLTTILVAHRLATVISADIIFVMQKGKVVESGNHYELVGKNGVYKELWDYQKL
jgi:ABC-type bacteriocin transporter